VPRVVLVHWNAAEAAERVKRLRDEGIEAEPLEAASPAGLRALAARPPDAIAIDLARLPSHGREIGVALRQRKGTRGVPLVFIEGDPEKTARVRALLPDAAFTSWSGAAGALRHAMDHPPAEPIVPGVFAGYSGTPLLKKLRIGSGTAVALLDPPEGFERVLGPLPEGARLVKTAGGAAVVLLFVRSGRALERRLPAFARTMPEGQTLWVVWPKKASGLASDIGEIEVRRTGLAAGIVDYKICSIDETWSGLAFAVRRKR
jgi:CheY-like chemotaxis protein